ncbi:MAG: NAD(P)H-binding protein [Verrucomicrobiota bacterium]
MPYAIMGLTGQVGGAIARHLLRQGKPVCGIVRDPKKAADWQAQGVELVVAESTDAAALRAAFEGVDGAFIMLPPFFAPSPDFREARAVARAVVSAVEAARPPRLVQLSTVGGHHDHAVGILAQLHIFENALAAAGLPVPTAVLRPAWFMENAAWDVASAREGVINSFLQPLDRPIAMAATDDIGRAAAELLLGSWTGPPRRRAGRPAPLLA